MLNKFKIWFYNSPFAFIIGLICLGLVTAALCLTLFGEKIGLFFAIAGGLIGSIYTNYYHKAQYKHLASESE